MRLYWVLLALGIGAVSGFGQNSAQVLAADAWQLENSGQGAQARERLQRAAEATPANPGALLAYAEFLERHRDPAARDGYLRLARALENSGAPREQRAAAARRLAVLDAIAGDREAAARHLADYSAAGGAGLTLPPPANKDKNNGFIEIPGPLRSFARMAALSPDLNPEDLLPALARNVVTNGYQAISANEALEQTEYLKLVVRYLTQAREIEKLAGASKIIKIDTCESTATG